MVQPTDEPPITLATFLAAKAETEPPGVRLIAENLSDSVKTIKVERKMTNKLCEWDRLWAAATENGPM